MRTRLPFGLLLLFFSVPVSAQEAGLLLSRGWSEQEELQNPIGFSAYASLSPLPFIDIRASHSRHFRAATEKGLYCAEYTEALIPVPSSCMWERVRREGQLRSSSVAGLLVAPLSNHVRLGIGYGRTWNTVEATGENLDSERSVPQARLPKPDLSGSLWIMTAGVGRLFGPFGLSSTLTRNSIEFNSCVDDAYGPFCGAATFTNLEIGIMYRIPGA